MKRFEGDWKMTTNFIPVIVGTDINAYYMSRNFHEEYGVRPYILGKAHLPFTEHSSIIEHIELDNNLDDPVHFLDILVNYAKKIGTKDKPLLLVGTNDKYVRLIVENQEKLKELFTFNYLDVDLLNTFMDKELFYTMAEKEKISIPETHFYAITEPFDSEITKFPVILKPADGIEYNEKPFPGQEKIYRLNSREEVEQTIKMIKASGYSDSLIIQDYIPGDDTLMWDSVVYVNSKGKAELVTFGQVALQEHTPTAIGNYTAIVSRYNEKMMRAITQFLEKVNYRGFANVDMKYDKRDGTFKVFEINVRQGRSSYYATQMGHNLAKYLVDDVIHNKEKELTLAYEEALFSVVPKYILKKYVTNEKMNQEIRELIKKKKLANPLFYKEDKSFKRKLYLLARKLNYNKKYKDSNW